MARVRLTKTLVDDIAPPETGQSFVWDSDVPGFGVRITPTGIKAWVVQTRVRLGKERRMTIGLCSKVPLDKARLEARKLIATADLGRDPAQERKEAREVKPDMNPVFGDFAERWLAEVVAKRNRAGTEKHRRLLIKNHIAPALGEKRLNEITRKDIDDLHQTVSEKFPVAANRAVSVCSAILGTAVRWGLLERNPALQAHRNGEEGRERYLTPEEIKALNQALDDSPAQDSADVVRLLMLTGARFGEVAGMRWEQLDLEIGLWTKPAATTKQNRTHRVPLSPAAVAVLTKRQQAACKADQTRRARKTERAAVEGNPWVFPGDGADGHMTTIRSFWAAICKRASIKGARIHDLRHTFASLLVSSGESLPVVGALLGHTQAKTTSRYAHLLDDPLRKAAARVAELAQGGGKLRPEDFVYVSPNGAVYAMEKRHRPWWKWPADYDPIMEQPNPQIAWEFLRRNPRYFQAYFSWKAFRSEVISEILSEDHPRWKDVFRIGRKICKDFDLDQSFFPASPLSSETCPLLGGQVLQTQYQVVSFLENEKDQILLSENMPFGRRCFVTVRGRGWPRKKKVAIGGGAYRRREFLIYLRLLDAKAEGAGSSDIRLWMECYRGKPREEAQQALNNHWRAAKRMMEYGYRRLAATH